MKTDNPHPIYLKDYTPPSHSILSVELTFSLQPSATRVKNRMHVVRDSGSAESALELQGDQLRLLNVWVDDVELQADAFSVSEEGLTLHEIPSDCWLTVETEIDPASNHALEGLYRSGALYCTQNEPEGFRRITYFLDRSDVMARYTTKIIADKSDCPVLLSNGNLIDQGELEDGRHWVVWEDPFPKPSYLFALVAGDLGWIQDTFVTQSGRSIDLRIYCDPGNESRCHHAMESLKKAMQWDEQVYGLEYDLDIYMIVAVDSFNMGAMENKGLNIFNTSCVLADEKTATDDNYLRVEAVIAHEYFHNWTGNRVTCRDWFQLTLKEGLTVFRDQEFTADMHSSAVKRIQDVRALRSRQFLEDAGPMAHPIQPQSYIEINNFYTSTVYNKGAEVIRMLYTLLGKKTFLLGIQKYFERYDGQAVTTEDFLKAMEEVSGRDFSQFRRWYYQAGTPQVSVSSNYNPSKKIVELTIHQTTPPTADGSSKKPFHFPFAVGLLSPAGNELSNHQQLLEVTQEKETFVIEEVEEDPILSLNRHFSAPVQVNRQAQEDDQYILMAYDSDPFNRWDAGQQVGLDLLLQLADKESSDKPLENHSKYIEALGKILQDSKLDSSLKACALLLPDEEALAREQDPIQFDANRKVREWVKAEFAATYKNDLRSLYEETKSTEPYRFSAEAMGCRSLKNTCLHYLAYCDNEVVQLCVDQYHQSDNMTDRFAAMQVLNHLDTLERDKVLKDFYEQWKKDPLVMTKWFALQASSRLPNRLEEVLHLEQDPAFSQKIPNLVRALYGNFAMNLPFLHSKDGSGYAFLAERVVSLDAFNPHMAAGLAGAFKRSAKVDDQRKENAKTELKRILALPNLSANTYEICSKTLTSIA